MSEENEKHCGKRDLRRELIILMDLYLRIMNVTLSMSVSSKYCSWTTLILIKSMMKILRIRLS